MMPRTNTKVNLQHTADVMMILECDTVSIRKRPLKLAKIFQVSWLRGSDSQVLSSGFTKFTGDRRVRVIPADRSHTWALAIANVTTGDSGSYLCQVNTEPKISLRFLVTVAGD